MKVEIRCGLNYLSGLPDKTYLYQILLLDEPRMHSSFYVPKECGSLMVLRQLAASIECLIKKKEALLEDENIRQLEQQIEKMQKDLEERKKERVVVEENKT